MKPDDRERAARERNGDESQASGACSAEMRTQQVSAGGPGAGSAGRMRTDADALDAGRADGRVFDRWLVGKLDQIYDELLARPVPERLVRMIRRHGGKKS